MPDTSWRRLREPSPWSEKLVSLPIAVVAAVVVAVLWFILTPLQDIMHAVSLQIFLLSFAGIVVVHELLHALAHPMAGRPPHSIVGFSPSQAFFYGHYDGEMSRNRFLTILLTPLIIISIVPLLVSAAAQISSGWIAIVSVVNAFCSCSDMLLAGLVLFQIPATGIVRQQCWRTYWRDHDELSA